MPLYPQVHINKLNTASTHREAEQRARGSGSPDNLGKLGEGYLFTARAGVVQWSNASPTEGLLCGDAIITTTLPLSIYRSQSSPPLSLSLSDSPY